MTHDPLTLTAAFVLAVIATARAVRLVTSDAYPPVENLRVWWEVKQINRDAHSDARTGTLAAVRTGWAPLLTCPFCFAPYAAAVNLAWGIAALHHLGVWWADAWWVANAWAALSYLAAMLVVRDEPPAED